PITHLAHRKGDGARVDLWPLIEPPEKPDDLPWGNPVDLPPRNNPKSVLAEHLATEIARMIAEETLPARAGEAPRRVTPGDILVLVRKRDRLAQTLIQRLKSLGVPVAGADRLSLAGELAVKDLLALIKAVIQPLDELSLAAVLRSPLCDMDEEALFDLAHGREGTLWQALMAGDAPSPDREMLRDLASRAGFLGPYDFLERVLIRHDGRRRLVARLGLEAEDPLDELLAEALSYEARETPTLSGFVAWIEAGDIQIKREMDQGAGEVRVMTIHGAKGLEAPIVILPDTVHGQSGGGRQVLLEIGGAGNAPAMTLWAGAKPTDDRVTRAAREAAAAKAEAEGRRLLYVGLTRAEDWLILAGAGDETIAEKGWYGQLSKAMGAFETIDILSAAGPIKRVERTAPASPPAAQVEAAPELPAEPPSWVTPAPREARATHLTPSALAPHGAASGAGLGREPALAHGLAVHLLLERLPEIAPDQWRDAAARLGASEAAMAEALACLEAPFAAEVFGPGSLGEVAMAAPLGATSMRGRIDRLVVSPERVLVVDFKSDAAVPADDEGVPQAYLAQLGAYGAALAGVYPDRRIETAILWTRAPRLHGISAAATSAALRAALAEQGIDLPRSDA
ncbi:MAG: 3'-5' exonuclease, partial [Pseudomonadota bacterium]